MSDIHLLLPCLASMSILATVVALNALRLAAANRQLRASQREAEEANCRLDAQLRETLALQRILQDQVMRDSLTGLYNRRYLDDVLEREIVRALRADAPLSVVLLDLDHFKRINDNYGHPAGDKALHLLAALLKANVRGSDIICRYGGEEFLVLLPGATPDIARQRAEQWRELVGEAVLACGGRHLQVTASFGVAGFPAHAPTAEALVRAADAALYRAKRGGRNRVAVADAPVAAAPAPALRIVAG